MDVVFKSFDLLLDVISGDLIIFNNATNNEFVDTEGDGFLLVLGLPEKSVNDDLSDDLLGELVEVGLSFPRLNVKEDERFGNDNFLSLLGLGLGFFESLFSFLHSI